MYDLKRHMACHFDTGSKYMCRFCGKALKRQQTLREHERSHTGENPYRCQYCEYSAKSSNVLRKHNLAKHPNLVQGLKRRKSITEEFPHLKKT